MHDTPEVLHEVTGDVSAGMTLVETIHAWWAAKVTDSAFALAATGREIGALQDALFDADGLVVRVAPVTTTGDCDAAVETWWASRVPGSAIGALGADAVAALTDAVHGAGGLKEQVRGLVA